MKILVVEDDPFAQLMLESALHALGHDVVVAPHGEAAWPLLAPGSARVVVSDWRMPRMGGLELCRKIRQRAGDYVYFILLTSAEATDENHKAAMDAGVDDFLTKPVNLRELRLRLHVAERILSFATQVKELESFLPICGYCKKIRDDKNYWQQIEAYLNARTGTQFSHGVCPDCYEREVAPQLAKLMMPDEGGPGGAK